jgi:hypothetical protein
MESDFYPDAEIPEHLKNIARAMQLTFAIQFYLKIIQTQDKNRNSTTFLQIQYIFDESENPLEDLLVFFSEYKFIFEHETVAFFREIISFFINQNISGDLIKEIHRSFTIMIKIYGLDEKIIHTIQNLQLIPKNTPNSPLKKEAELI